MARYKKMPPLSPKTALARCRVQNREYYLLLSDHGVRTLLSAFFRPCGLGFEKRPRIVLADCYHNLYCAPTPK